MPEARRSHRIEVDKCGECPFLELLPASPRRWYACKHPSAEPEEPGMTGVGEPDDNPAEIEPAQWCPLRGSVTMITGPAQPFPTGAAR